MEVVGGDLSLPEHHNLLGIGLGVLAVVDVSVADGDEGQAQGVEVALPVVGDVPAQGVVPDLVILVALLRPLLGGEAEEGGQGKFELAELGLEVLDDGVDLRTLHS